MEKNTRKYLFIFICLPIRITFAILPLLLSQYTSIEKKTIVWIYFVLSIIAFIFLIYKLSLDKKNQHGIFGGNIW